MQKAVIVLLALLPGLALAQPAPPMAPPDPAVLQAAIQALQRQRTQAQDEAAAAEAQLVVAQGKIVEMQKELDALRDKAKNDAKPPPEEQGPTFQHPFSKP